MKRLVTWFGSIIFLLVLTGFFGGWILSKNPQPFIARRIVPVAVIFTGSKTGNDWNQTHFSGFEQLRSDMGIRLIYRDNVPEEEGAIRKTVKDLVENEHAEIIFATSFHYSEAIAAIAPQYPQVKFFCVASSDVQENVATFFGRMYQVRYLAGIVAGMQTKSNAIGYVAAFPIPEVIRGIDAFTLGVRRVNPRAVVHVRWTHVWADAAVEKGVTEQLLREYPVDVLAEHQDDDAVVQSAKEHHIQVIGSNLDHQKEYPEGYLTAVLWNWGDFYRDRLQECLDGRFKGQAYFEGYGHHLFELAPFSPRVSAVTRTETAKAKEQIESGNWDVFFGPIYDQQGHLRIRAGENLSDRELLTNMDWFVQGVEGNTTGR